MHQKSKKNSFKYIIYFFNTNFVYSHLPSSTFELEADLSIIDEMIIESKRKNMKCIILGDFNVDFNRQNSHTQTLLAFMEKNCLSAAEFFQTKTHIYS